MKARTSQLGLIAIGILVALAPAAQAATPFTAGTGDGQDLAVGSEGTGHLVWVTNEADNRVGYCRIPAGGTACDSESTFLDFPGAGSDSPSPHAQVFTPAASTVVIFASCTQCTASPQRTFRFTSTNNGVDFSAGVQVGDIALNGQGSYVYGVGLSVSGSVFQAQNDGPSSTSTLPLGASPGSSVYDASTAVSPPAEKAVYAVNDLHNVEYRVFTNPAPPGVTAAELNNGTYWSATKFLSAAEGENDETRLSSGPNGIFLTYRYKQPTDNRMGLRKFDPVTSTFGSPSYIEGNDPIENSGLGESSHSQDGSGRLHVVWRTLYDGNRLRYTHSDAGGANFTPAANLATRESFFSPVVEASPAGTGFAAWRSSDNAIRVVPIDPQPEPAGGGPGGGGGPDTTAPSAGGFGIGDSTLFPGAGADFSFTSSEAGVAVLTIQKRVKGMKVRIRGRVRCVPQTRRRIRALHGWRIRRCGAYKRVGSIRQTVSPGRNTIRFNGRIAGRRLRPGRYRALLVITDSAGNVSRTERINFRVLRRRR